MHRTILVLSLAVAGLLPGALGADELLKIASWNIQNLGERDWGQHPAALAEQLALAGADVLALQEIHDTDGDPATRTSRELDALFERLNADPGQDWTYVLFPKANPRHRHQHTGLAWNRERVTRVGEPFAVPIDAGAEGAVWRRPPYAVKLSAGKGKSDLVLIPVHMKSNYDGAEGAREKRAREAALLAPALAAVKEHFSDGDLVVLGDTNCLDSQEPALLTLRQAGLSDLNQSDTATYRDGAAPFDRILVPAGQAEFRFSRQYVLYPSDPGAHFGRLSDHFLVMTAVRVLADDD